MTPKARAEYYMVLFKRDKFSALVCVGEIIRALEALPQYAVSFELLQWREVKKELHNINPKK